MSAQTRKVFRKHAGKCAKRIEQEILGEAFKGRPSCLNLTVTGAILTHGGRTHLLSLQQAVFPSLDKIGV